MGGSKTIFSGGTVTSGIISCIIGYIIIQNENCVASGPGKDMFESTWIIGQKQYDKGKVGYGE